MNYFKKCVVKMDKSSIVSKEMSDEEYFSNEYVHYCSNSRLKLINPDEGGSAELYKTGFNNGYNSSLEFGTAVHQLLLQNEDYELIEYYDKPAGKLGRFIECLVDLEDENNYNMLSQSEKDNIKSKLMVEASKKAEYYASSFSKKRQDTAMEKGKTYYNDLRNNNICPDCKVIPIILPKKMLDSVYACMDRLVNTDIIRELQDQNLFNTKIFSNEEALFVNFNVTLADGEEVVVPFKLKIDNYTIDEDNGVITLNDVKTSGKQIKYFMGGNDSDGVWHNGSFQKFHYYRQLAAYFYVLREYLKPKYPNIKKHYANILLIESIPEFANQKTPINNEYIKAGMSEFKELLIRVAYYEKYGKDITDDEVKA